MTHRVASATGRVEITLRSEDGRLEKTLTIFATGAVRASFVWDTTAFPGGVWFTTELSLAREVVLDASEGAEVWQHPIETVAKSERGLERTLQGVSYLVRWPVAQGRGDVEVPA
jgi:hypothetical protein